MNNVIIIYCYYLHNSTQFLITLYILNDVIELIEKERINKNYYTLKIAANPIWQH